MSDPIGDEDIFAQFGKAPAEASAESRDFAKGIRQFYVGLVNEGFSPDEALTLIAKTIVASKEEEEE